MTVHPQPHPPRPMVQPFPRPGKQVQLACRELHLASNGTPEQKKQIGNPALLPRPWEPDSCHHVDLRHQLWQWLDQVVTWLNHEYTWGTTEAIPSCWPHHPHLVRGDGSVAGGGHGLRPLEYALHHDSAVMQHSSICRSGGTELLATRAAPTNGRANSGTGEDRYRIG